MRLYHDRIKDRGLNVRMQDYIDGLHERLKKARKDLNLGSQEKVAQEIGATREAFAQYETGRSPIPHRHMAMFCKIYNISVDWLLYGEGPMERSRLNTLIEELPNYLDDAAVAPLFKALEAAVKEKKRLENKK